jgi:hypothetical protein
MYVCSNKKEFSVQVKNKPSMDLKHAFILGTQVLIVANRYNLHTYIVLFTATLDKKHIS